jgi:hypothetical protein
VSGSSVGRSLVSAIRSVELDDDALGADPEEQPARRRAVAVVAAATIRMRGVMTSRRAAWGRRHPRKPGFLSGDSYCRQANRAGVSGV